MSRVLSFRNRQHVRAVNVPLLRRITRHLLEDELGAVSYELGFHLVAPDEMAAVNQRFLRHKGSTDVITFDYNNESDSPLHGEIFISVADAVQQAREFGTNWQSELVRYVIHGLLHLEGYDDLQPDQRRVMKRAESRLLKAIAVLWQLRQLAAPRKTQRRNLKS